MADVTLQVADRFTVGDTIGAYLRTSWPPPVAPGVASDTSVVQANGTVTFNGLTPNVQYYASRASGVGGSVMFATQEEVVVPAGGVAGPGYAGQWAAQTVVEVGEIRSVPSDGSVIFSLSTRTTRATYDATEVTFWESVGVDTSDIEGQLDAHISDAIDVHAASAITVDPEGVIMATTVQGALVEGASRSGVTWVPYSGNPIIPAVAGATSLTGFGDVWFDSINKVFEACVMVDSATPGIYRYTSIDGLTGWVADTNNPLITVGTAGAWDATTVGVPRWWEEAGAWKMLYRGTGPGGVQTGLATASAAGGPWTKYASNPVITAASIGGVAGGEANPPIKVGSAYYLFHSGQGYNRAATCLTSTDLISWTAVAARAQFQGGRFCPNIWKDGQHYYAAVPHYTEYNASAELELWRSPNPTFLPAERQFMGILRKVSTAAAWESQQMDTPAVPADNITRSSYACTGSKPRIYYSGQAASNSFWTMGVLIPSTTLGAAAVPQKPLTPVGPWYLDDPTASQTDIQIPLLGSTTKQFYAFPFSAHVVAMQAWTETNVTAGSVTINVTNWLGNKTYYTRILQGVIGVGAQRAGDQVEEGDWYFAHGEGVGIKVTTSAGLTPANLKLQVSLAVILR